MGKSFGGVKVVKARVPARVFSCSHKRCAGGPWFLGRRLIHFRGKVHGSRGGTVGCTACEITAGLDQAVAVGLVMRRPAEYRSSSV